MHVLTSAYFVFTGLSLALALSHTHILGHQSLVPPSPIRTQCPSALAGASCAAGADR